MIEFEGFSFESNQAKDHENDQGDYFLNHFELNKRKGPAISWKTNSICWDLKAIFKERDSPADQNNWD